MRLRIQGYQTEIAAHVLGWIAERLEDLNGPHGDIFSAEVTLSKHKHQIETRIELMLAGKTLGVTQRRKTQDEAVLATLRAIERQLDAFRLQQHPRQGRMPRIRGRVTHLFRNHSYGVIETDTYQKVFFHAQAVQGVPFERLHVDMVVAVDLESGQSGALATRVVPH